MADYSTNSAEFSKMQEEALERLREMQRRSRSMVAPGASSGGDASSARTSAGSTGGSGGRGVQNANRPSDNSRSAPSAGQPLLGGGLLGQGFSVSEIFKSILGEAGKLDTDSLLILLMLFTLYKNKADIKLLVALGYILL